MLQITRQLSDSPACNFCAASGLLPVATVSLEVNGEMKSVNVVLEGTIVGASSKALHTFLRDVACFPGNRWTLQMQQLSLLSMRGIQGLVRFARILRRRGFILEVHGIHHNVYASLRDFKLLHAFGWAD